jgi:hypothetical protein
VSCGSGIEDDEIDKIKVAVEGDTAQVAGAHAQRQALA